MFVGNNLFFKLEPFASGKLQNSARWARTNSCLREQLNFSLSFLNYFISYSIPNFHDATECCCELSRRDFGTRSRRNLEARKFIQFATRWLIYTRNDSHYSVCINRFSCTCRQKRRCSCCIPVTRNECICYLASMDKGYQKCIQHTKSGFIMNGGREVDLRTLTSKWFGACSAFL